MCQALLEANSAKEGDSRKVGDLGGRDMSLGFQCRCIFGLPGCMQDRRGDTATDFFSSPHA